LSTFGRLISYIAMNMKSLLLFPAALALSVPAHAYIGFGLNLAVPLYYPAPVYRQRVTYQAQPVGMTDAVTASPGPGYVWMAGHWSNQARRWVWISGHWELPPSPSGLWVGGHWVQGNAGWVWVDGAWSVGSPPAQPGAEQGNPPPPEPPSGPGPAGPGPAPTASAVPVPSAPPPAPNMAEGTEVEADPPAPVVEYVPTDPYPGYVWVGGFWAWNGGWYWNAGHYSRPPFRGAAWVGGRWARGTHGWAWHGGRWR
jgi:hypothetical protein